MNQEKFLNKWRIALSFYRRPEYLDGRRTFCFGVYKMISFPPEGQMVTKENYKGFLWRFTVLIYRGR